MNVYELFDVQPEGTAERPALITGLGCQRAVVTFAALERKVRAASAALAAGGLAAGDRVLLALPPSVDCYVAMLAMLYKELSSGS